MNRCHFIKWFTSAEMTCSFLLPCFSLRFSHPWSSSPTNSSCIGLQKLQSLSQFSKTIKLFRIPSPAILCKIASRQKTRAVVGFTSFVFTGIAVWDWLLNGAWNRSFGGGDIFARFLDFYHEMENPNPVTTSRSEVEVYFYFHHLRFKQLVLANSIFLVTAPWFYLGNHPTPFHVVLVGLFIKVPTFPDQK